LKEARKAGYKIPDLEHAMRNVTLREAEEAARKAKESGEAHKGQTGQMVSAKDRRAARREQTEAEKQAAEKVKQAKSQTVEKKESGKKVKATATA
jgi:small subunit ribosomal protein S17